MKNSSTILYLLALLTLLCQCDPKNPTSISDNLSDSLQIICSESSDNIICIKIPDDFNPTIPMSQLEQKSLRDLVVEKYYSFKERKNQKRLHDAQSGIGLQPQRVLSQREEFENAALIESIEWLHNRSLHPNIQINYSEVSEYSNLAKALFIQEFGLFVFENEMYCKEILDSIEKQEYTSAKTRNMRNQEKYK